MTKKELISRLACLHDDEEVMILDGFNGGGYPRTINYFSSGRIITESDAEESADCEGKVGERVAIVGFGCY